MRRLIKKSNLELNNILVEYFKNQNIDCNHYYYFKKNKAYDNILHEIRFSVYGNTSKFDERYQKQLIDYFEVLRQETESYNLNNMAYIAKELIMDIIEKRENTIETTKNQLEYVIPVNFLFMCNEFMHNETSLKKRGFTAIPYTIKNSSFSVLKNLVLGDISLTISFLIEYNQNKEQYNNKIHEVKVDVLKYIKHIIQETDFVKTYLSTQVNKQYWSIDDMISMFLNESKKEEKNKTSIHITKHFTFDDFMSQFKDDFKREVIDVLENKLWNELNIINKQHIRNFIKKEKS